MDRYERPRIPVVITGLCDEWRAASAWRQPDLLERYGDHKFKVLQGSLLCFPFWLHVRPAGCCFVLAGSNLNQEFCRTPWSLPAARLPVHLIRKLH